MVTKTYKCPVHGEFDHDCNINDPELKKCPIDNYEPDGKEDKPPYKYTGPCNKPVTRVFKKLTYMDSIGFCGKVYGSP